MDEIVEVVVAVVSTVARFAWELIVQVVWEIMFKGVIGFLIRLVWPRKQEAEDKDEELSEIDRG